LKVQPINLSPKSIYGLAQVLKFTLSLYVLAFCLKLKKGAVISSVLVVENGYSELSAFWIEKSVAIVLLLSLIGIFFRITHKTSLWIITVFIVGYALLSYFNGGKAFLELSLISAVSKWWLPLLTLIAINAHYNQKQSFSRGFLFGIQLSIFLIFLSHGIGCFLKNALYIDYIIGFVGDYTPFSIKQYQAEQLLNIIGIIDVVVAVLVLLKPSKNLLYWLIFWGLLTSLLRIVDAGIFNYIEFLIRTPHFGLPIALLIIWNNKTKAENYSSSPSLSKS
jgi:hypothetical protein